ncbi:hypothetical protein [Actinocorallia sp. A-T 12471]|uniref:hypothetical protein n=1 Tax=Actinocorallia sp. A-T 12471 TaxID=3089813 RepID=UPI0029D3FF7B|nr:hypothetical protein [Actinocorallia sp. A-T 12471]MDX6740663.1 hypothetical protein [Actinocorallia sp. A-T 12471]
MKDDVGPDWMDDGFYFIRPAAKTLGVGAQSLRDWCHHGLIRHHKGSTNRIVVCAADIDAIRAEVIQSNQLVKIEIVRRLHAMGRIGFSRGTARDLFPGNLIPRDVAFGLIQEAMREALIGRGMLKGSVDVIVGNAVSKLEFLLDTHLSSDDNGT